MFTHSHVHTSACPIYDELISTTSKANKFRRAALKYHIESNESTYIKVCINASYSADLDEHLFILTIGKGMESNVLIR